MHHELARLREKLCGELGQSERDAQVHAARAARRLGDTAVAAALSAIAAHAEAVLPGFEAVTGGHRLGRAVGAAVSELRRFLFERPRAAERSARGVLVGLRHGVGLARLLREVAARGGEVALRRWCDDFLDQRLRLIELAEAALAARPGRARAGAVAPVRLRATVEVG